MSALSLPDPVDGPAWIDDVEHRDNPYLHGFYTPVVDELTQAGLEVEGEIPSDLYGAYFRQSPNPRTKPKTDYHFFDGDGMLYGVYLRDGKASFIRKWIKTAALKDDLAGVPSSKVGIMGPFDMTDAAARDFQVENLDYARDTSNTTINSHAGALVSCWYNSGEVYKLDPRTLDTLGTDSFGGGLTSTLNAHPKTDKFTGEMIGYGYSDFDPAYTYYVFDAQGGTKHKARIEMPGPRLPHDTTITTNFTILHDFPLYHDPDLLRRIGRRVVQFHRDVPTRFGVIPRYGVNADVKWFEFEPGFVLHMVNAWEEGDEIIMDGCFQPDPTIRRDPTEGPLASMLAYMRFRAHLRRWRMNMKTGVCSEEQLDDLNVEFCLPDMELYGTKTRYSYHQHMPIGQKTMVFKDLVKYDHQTMARQIVSYGDEWLGSEATFAKSTKGGAEDDGYVITICTNVQDFRSELRIYDAREIDRAPLATVKMPARCGPGFHATWVPGAEIWGQAA